MHISLDSELGQQRRLNQVGETITSIAAPAAAYSLRSLTGGDPLAVRVRRDTSGGAGDDDEQDFTVSQINSGALVDFVGSGNDGFVSTWYDQSGNGKHATQGADSKEPKIVDSGSLISGGLEFDLASFSTLLIPSSIYSNLNSLSSFLVCKAKAVTAFNIALGLNPSASIGVWQGYHILDELALLYNNTNTVTLGSVDANTHLHGLTFGSTNSRAFFDGTLISTFSSANVSVSASTFSIGSVGDSFGHWDSTIEELIIYDSDQFSNSTKLQANIKNYYSIS